MNPSERTFFDRWNPFLRNGWLRVLRPIEVNVYLVYLNHMGEDGIAFPGADRIAEMVGSKPNHVRAARKRLIALGLMEQVDAGGGAGHTGHYQILVPGDAPETVNPSRTRPRSEAEHADEKPVPNRDGGSEIGTGFGAEKPVPKSDGFGEETRPESGRKPVPNRDEKPVPNRDTEGVIRRGSRRGGRADRTGEGEDVTTEEPDPIAVAKRFAVTQFDRWSTKYRGHDLNPQNNETRAVWDLVDSLADDSPLIVGGSPVGRHLLIPRAVEVCMAKGSKFKHIRYAVETVRSVLAEWAIEGVPGSRDSPAPGGSRQQTPSRQALPAGQTVQKFGW